MARISKKKRIAELEKRVSGLEAEKFPEELPENIKEQIRGIVRSETERLSDDLDKVRKDSQTINAQLVELTEKVRKFFSSTQETTKMVVTDAQGILNKLKEVLSESFFEEKAEEAPEAQEPTGVEAEQVADPGV